MVPPCGLKKFTGHGYTDGSERSYAGWRTSRAAYAIILVAWNNRQWKLIAAVISPLSGWYQSTPLAELAAAVFYISNTIDAPNLILHSDCQWVVDGVGAGLEATAGALNCHADWWKRLQRCKLQTQMAHKSSQSG